MFKDFFPSASQARTITRYDCKVTLRLVIVSLLLLSFSFMQTACVTKYPESEGNSFLTYPLPVCTEEKLVLMKMQINETIERRGASGTICVTGPLPKKARTSKTSDQKKIRLVEQRNMPYEKNVRAALEPPFMKNGPEKTFGIALSGGGSKSSSFSMGVMAGLADHQLLDSADYISTVSGGGYAAYFYYAHHLFPLLRKGGRPVVTNTDLYRDCIDEPPPELAIQHVIDLVKKVNHCSRPGLVSISKVAAQKAEDIRYQAFLRCTQDILRPGQCDINTTERLDFGLSKISLLGSISLFPFSNIANTLFDWGYSTSPTARTYHDGIGLSNGATFASASAVAGGQRPEGMTYCGPDTSNDNKIFDCFRNTFDPDPQPLTFDDLRTGLLKLNAQPDSHIPFWIINATAPQSRSVFGWLGKSRDDVSNHDMFEMTAVSHGSGRYGYVSAPVSIYDMTTLDAVAASAAFLDSNQLVYQNRVGKTLAGLGLHLANLDWGYDIPNYNVSTRRRQIHRALPVPFYYADGLVAGLAASGPNSEELKNRKRSVYIRLIDGGNSENLGVYSLIKRDTKTILISDAAQDVKGLFGDICGLKTRLSNSTENLFPRYLYVPGLAQFDEHCKNLGASEGYDLHRWSVAHPILVGCVRSLPSKDPEHEACQNLDKSETRLFIIKPAIDLPNFVKNQLITEGISAKVSKCHVRDIGAEPEDKMLNCDTAVFIVANRDKKNSVKNRDGKKLGTCPIFPQHGTALMTANSSATLFVAYRELARQYIGQRAEIIKEVISGSKIGHEQFQEIASQQGRKPLGRGRSACTSF
ncbi:MAG: hypothetical protein ACI83P_001103 [Janthinobacterium sp.]|jgi:hypothetical protein